MTTTKQYTTRNLTSEESARLVQELHLALCKSHLVDSVLRVIAGQGLGIFAAEEVQD